MLDQETLKTLVTYIPETGEFFWKIGVRGSTKEKLAGGKSDGYTIIRIDKKNYKSHRLAWLFVHGVWPSFEIDHINGVRSDNRLCNIRDVSRCVNAQNLIESMPKRSKDAPLGVSWHRAAKKWRAMIWDGSKNIYLGLFEDADIAHMEYVKAKRLMHPGCTI